MASFPRTLDPKSPPKINHNSAINNNNASPARGAEMRDFLHSRLKTRIEKHTPAPAPSLAPYNNSPPISTQQPKPQSAPTGLPLVHSWDFYHDRQTAPNKPTPTSTNPSAPYTARLEQLASIADVQHFWSVFNNFSLADLSIRDSVHLFKRGVQPLWEDPRNLQGGRWTFRIGRSHAQQAWTEVALLAVGEGLQAAVENLEGDEDVVDDEGVKRKAVPFRDDICGISLSIRFNSALIQVWNRDAGHLAGVARLKDVVLEGLSDEVRPRDESKVFYKRHFDKGPVANVREDGELKNA